MNTKGHGDSYFPTDCVTFNYKHKHYCVVTMEDKAKPKFTSLLLCAFYIC